jgi:general secretion pathway protein G
MKNLKFQKPAGFTLMELLIVIAIIAVLTTFTVANFLTGRTRARDAQRKSDLRQIQAALELYRADQGTYPPLLPACGSSLTSGGVKYMQKVPCDPANSGQQIYTYVYTGIEYKLVSCLENINDKQKDASNDAGYCAGGATNWSYTLTNP